ncbi:MAG: phenylacetate--CoA ligase family protein, partial [Clostridiales bacterium]|nr:phenylacetate--CoA ligase family protein [Clostridiales bacterium]
RSDDMVKIKGSIIYPGMVDSLLAGIENVSSEYQIMIDHLNGRDILRLFVETALSDKSEIKELEKNVENIFKSVIGVTPEAKAVAIGELPRSEKKSTRIFDNRY